MNESTPQNNKLGTQPIGKLLFSMAIPTTCCTTLLTAFMSGVFRAVARLHSLASVLPSRLFCSCLPLPH